MRLLIMALLLVSVAAAFNVEPDYIGVQDTGSESLPTLDVDIAIDCDTNDVTASVSDDGQPVEGANGVLFYTDYGYQPLPGGGKTDSSGQVTMPVPGTIDFLTALFILRTDASGYQSREIEFAYEKCFEPPPEPEPYEEPEEPVVAPPTDVSDDTNATPPVAPAPNATPPANVTPPVNGTPPDATGPEEAPAPLCPLGFLLLSALAIRSRA